MKLGDFSSLVQLGIGLHAGTALFQFVSEFASLPLQRKLQRLHKIANGWKRDEESERALDLAGDLETRAVQFFNEYRVATGLNCLFALALLLLLIWISVDVDQGVNALGALLLVGLSSVPAPVTLLILWRRWVRNTSALRNSVSALEKLVLGPSNRPSG